MRKLVAGVAILLALGACGAPQRVGAASQAAQTPGSPTPSAPMTPSEQVKLFYQSNVIRNYFAHIWDNGATSYATVNYDDLAIVNWFNTYFSMACNTPGSVRDLLHGIVDSSSPWFAVIESEVRGLAADCTGGTYEPYFEVPFASAITGAGVGDRRTITTKTNPRKGYLKDPQEFTFVFTPYGDGSGTHGAWLLSGQPPGG